MVDTPPVQKPIPAEPFAEPALVGQLGDSCSTDRDCRGDEFCDRGRCTNFLVWNSKSTTPPFVEEMKLLSAAGVAVGLPPYSVIE